MPIIIIAIIIFLAECFARGYKIRKAQANKTKTAGEIKRAKAGKRRKALANLRF